jgi:hypothetical protein
VKVAHAEGVAGVELFTGRWWICPRRAAAQIDKLADAVRLAAKLRLDRARRRAGLPPVVAAAGGRARRGAGRDRASGDRARAAGGLDRCIRDLKAQLA